MLCKSIISIKMIFVFTIILLCFCPLALSNIVLPKIPIFATVLNEIELDPYLRQAVLSNLGKPVESTDPITIDDIKNLKGTINIQGVALKSIKGLEYATSLDTLIINNTELEDVSAISNLNNLTHLILDDDKITTLPSFSNLSKLEYFEVHRNYISDLSPVLDAVNLKNLQINDNRISILPDMKRLSKLTTLYLSNNKISDLTPIAELASLENLYLSGNNISEYSTLANIANLKELFLDNNKIYDFPNNTIFKSLTSLNLSGNILSDYNFKEQFPALISFDLIGCNIRDFTAFMSHPTLENLLISSNQISDISPIVSSGNSKLIFINLANNEITDLIPLVKYDFPAEILLQGNNIDMNDASNIAVLDALILKHPYAGFNEYDYFDSLSIESGTDSMDLLKGKSYYNFIIHDKTAKINLQAQFSNLPYTYELEWVKSGISIVIPIIGNKISFQMDPTTLQEDEPIILKLKYNIYGEDIATYCDLKYYTIRLNYQESFKGSSMTDRNSGNQFNFEPIKPYLLVIIITITSLLIALLMFLYFVKNRRKKE